MNYNKLVLYVLLSGLSIVSFQNCGQSGAISLEQSSMSKLKADTPSIDQYIDISNDGSSSQPSSSDSTDIQEPSATVTPGNDQGTGIPGIIVIKDGDSEDSQNASNNSQTPGQSNNNSSEQNTMPPQSSPGGGFTPPSASGGSSTSDSRNDQMKSEPQVITPPVAGGQSSGSSSADVTQGTSSDSDIQETDVADVDDDGNIVKGKLHGCKALSQMRIRRVNESATSELKNVAGRWRISNASLASAKNYLGVLDIVNANTVSEVKNAGFFIRSVSQKLDSVENVRGFTIVRANEINSLKNLRGISCVAAVETQAIENVRGYMRVNGHLKSLKNFRGILYVDGRVDSLENFKGILILREGSSIGTRVDVKVRDGFIAKGIALIVKLVEK